MRAATAKAPATAKAHERAQLPQSRSSAIRPPAALSALTHFNQLLETFPAVQRNTPYETHIVTQGQDLDAVAALYPGVSAVEIATQNELDHFRLEPHRTLVIPGPELRLQESFKKATSYYQAQYDQYNQLYGAPDTTLVHGRPQSIGLKVSAANYQNVIGADGVRLQSTQIHLDPEQADLQQRVQNQYVEEQRQSTLSASAEKRTSEKKTAPKEMAGLGNTATGQLVPLRIEMNADKAQALRHEVYAYEKSARALGLGPNDKGLWGNLWEASTQRYSASFAGAKEIAGEFLGDTAWQRQAAIQRMSAQQRSHLAQQRADTQGAVNDFRDIQSALDLGRYSGGFLFGMLPYLPDVVLSAASGGTLAGLRVGATAAAVTRARMGTAFAGSYPSSVGDLHLAQHEQGSGLNSGAALGLALPYAAAHLFGAEGMAARLALPLNPIKKFNAVEGFKGEALRSTAAGLSKGTAEMGSGVGQKFIERSAQVTADYKQTFFNQDFLHQLPNVAVGSLLLGSGFGFALGGRRRPVAETPITQNQHTTTATLLPFATTQKRDRGYSVASQARTGTYDFPMPLDLDGFSGKNRAHSSSPTQEKLPASKSVQPTETATTDEALRAHVVDTLLSARPRTRQVVLHLLQGAPMSSAYWMRIGIDLKNAIRRLDNLAEQLSTTRADLKDFLNHVFGPDRAEPELGALFTDPLAWGNQHKPLPSLGVEHLSTLTLTQVQVLRYLLTGLNSKEIARHLPITHKTVRNVQTSLFQKLGVQSSEELQRRFVFKDEGLDPKTGPQTGAEALEKGLRYQELRLHLQHRRQLLEPRPQPHNIQKVQGQAFKVLKLLVDQQSKAQIAFQLNIAPKALQESLSKILGAYEVKTWADLLEHYPQGPEALRRDVMQEVNARQKKSTPRPQPLQVLSQTEMVVELLHLKPNTRKALLYFIQGASVSEVSRRLAKDPSGVNKLLRYGAQALRTTPSDLIAQLDAAFGLGRGMFELDQLVNQPTVWANKWQLPHKDASALQELSLGQVRVLRFSQTGASQKVIGQALGLAPKTVTNLLSEALKRIGVDRLDQLETHFVLGHGDKPLIGAKALASALIARETQLSKQPPIPLKTRNLISPRSLTLKQ